MIDPFKIVLIVILVGVLFGVFLLMREFWCWYFKLTDIKDELSQIRKALVPENKDEIK